MITINDLVRVKLNGAVYNVPVAGLERGCGVNSPITVKFYIDWDEGPIAYHVPLSEVEPLTGVPTPWYLKKGSNEN